MNKLLENYTVRKLEGITKEEEHSEIYLVLDKERRYIATVRVNLVASSNRFKIINFYTAGGGAEVQDEAGKYHYEYFLALEAVSSYVLEAIRYKHP